MKPESVSPVTTNQAVPAQGKLLVAASAHVAAWDEAREAMESQLWSVL